MDPILQHFEYAHLPEHLQQISQPFNALATLVANTLPRNAERSTALRKLLEAKDAAVRAALHKDTSERIDHNAVSAEDINYGQKPPA